MGLRDLWQNAKDWVSNTSNTFLHGEAYEPYDYYGSEEDAQEYASLNEQSVQEEPVHEGYYQQGWQGSY